MATVYKIHPAIGIARVGNSPEQFFIGPERVSEKPDPAGGFKDDQCRVKRQAARFRIFAHFEDGRFEELTSAQAEITWTVHLANKKASHPERGNNPSGDLDIDPGPRSLSAPNGHAAFDTGTIRFEGAPPVTVPLGEMRTDAQGRLLVLSAAGTSASPLNSGIDTFWANADWYDDIADGPVSATVRLRADGSTPTVLGAWVMSAPPKYAPQLDNAITLYDRLVDVMIEAGRLPTPTGTSYTADVQPILQRARDTRWVSGLGAGPHAWEDPVYSDELRSKVFSRLTTPTGAVVDMPKLNEDDQTGRLTKTQYEHMQRWSNNDFAKDWVGVPPVAALSPSGLDRAALEACVGGAFFPGIEAGGRREGDRPITDKSNFVEAFRIDHSKRKAGDMTRALALPWQADFWDCARNWWPVPRPDRVFPEGSTTAVSWTRELDDYEDMVDKWHTLGFVVRQGARYVEVTQCQTSTIRLLTPELDFRDVPAGPMGMVRERTLPIRFEVNSAAGEVVLEYAPGGGPSHPQLIADNATVRVVQATTPAIAEFWITYRTGAVDSVLPQQTVKIHAADSGESWTVAIFGNTVARRRTAAALVLDRSRSMSQDSGNGLSKHHVVQDAASTFLELMLPADGVSVVRFNQDAQVLQPVLQLEPNAGDPNRSKLRELIRSRAAFEPNGNSSIGDGLLTASASLAAAPDYNQRALVLLTDGLENRPRFLADVAPEIEEKTYAIGLGRPQTINVPELGELADNTAGNFWVTGALEHDRPFELPRYFLQALAGVNQSELAFDTSGRLRGQELDRIAFKVTEADSGIEVILLCPEVEHVDFRLQAPSGMILEPWRTRNDPRLQYLSTKDALCYRIVLPAELRRQRFEHAGTWHALLSFGKPRHERSESPEGTERSVLRNLFRAPSRVQPTPTLRSRALPEVRRAPKGPAPYALLVHAYSSVALRTHIEQDAFEPGAQVRIDAELSESGLPLREDAQVSVRVERPNATPLVVPLQPLEPGNYGGMFETHHPGVYRVHVQAHGTTRLGQRFTREQHLTAAVWRGARNALSPATLAQQAEAGEQARKSRLSEG